MTKEIKARLLFRGCDTGIQSIKPFRDEMNADLLAELFGRCVVDCIERNRKEGYDFQAKGFEVVCTIEQVAS